MGPSPRRPVRRRRRRGGRRVAGPPAAPWPTPPCPSSSTTPAGRALAGARQRRLFLGRQPLAHEGVRAGLQRLEVDAHRGGEGSDRGHGDAVAVGQAERQVGASAVDEASGAPSSAARISTRWTGTPSTAPTAATSPSIVRAASRPAAWRPPARPARPARLDEPLVIGGHLPGRARCHRTCHRARRCGRAPARRPGRRRR